MNFVSFGSSFSDFFSPSSQACLYKCVLLYIAGAIQAAKHAVHMRFAVHRRCSAVLLRPMCLSLQIAGQCAGALQEGHQPIPQEQVATSELPVLRCNTFEHCVGQSNDGKSA